MNELILFGAGATSLVNLGVGYFIGRKLANATPQHAAKRIHELGQNASNQLDRHIRRVDRVNSRIEARFSEMPGVQGELRSAIDELRDANLQLQLDLIQIQQELHSFNQRKRRRKKSPDAVDKPVRMVNLKQAILPSQRDEFTYPVEFKADTNYRPRRHAFKAQQLVASYDSGKIPAATEFQVIECWDIGPDGFSFLLLQPPEFKLLILVLGQSNERIYLSASVTRVSAFNERGITEFQVHCRFDRKMRPQLFK